MGFNENNVFYVNSILTYSNSYSETIKFFINPYTRPIYFSVSIIEQNNNWVLNLKIKKKIYYYTDY